MKIRLLSIKSAVLMLVLGGLGASAASQPNILFILADDLGAQGLGCFGNDFVETPNLDALAERGIKFTNGLAPAPTCLPSRAAILSGQYSPRTGCFRVADKHKGKEDKLRYIMPENHPLALDKVTMADALKAAGYATAMYGKWHVNFYKPQFHPRYQGFDEAIEIMGHYKARSDPKGVVPADLNSADYITDRAIEFMEKTTEEEQPFFLYLPYYLVHAPMESIPEYIEHFREKLADREVRSRKGVEEVAVVAAMTKHLDDCTGRLMEALVELGIEEDTLIVFTSDNGCYSDDFNGGLRARKGDHYEGGMRVPYIFNWPGKIEPGQTSDERIIGVDLYPTFLEMSGTAAPEGHPLDGVSLAPLLLQQKQTLPQRPVYCFHPKADVFKHRVPGGRWLWGWENVMYEGDFKIVERPEFPEVELYNLKDDPLEQHDLAQVNPEKMQVMMTRFQAWKKKIGAPPYVPNPSYTYNEAE